MATEVLNREELINKIWQTKGRVALVAESLGVSSQTIYNYADRYATVRAAIDHAQQHGDVLRVDLAESKLDQAIMKGERWAILNALDKSPEARRRGWGMQHRVEHSGDTQTTVRVIGLPEQD
jgi:hypothetical protein